MGKSRSLFVCTTMSMMTAIAFIDMCTHSSHAVEPTKAERVDLSNLSSADTRTHALKVMSDSFSSRQCLFIAVWSYCLKSSPNRLAKTRSRLRFQPVDKEARLSFYPLRRSLARCFGMKFVSANWPKRKLMQHAVNATFDFC